MKKLKDFNVYLYKCNDPGMKRNGWLAYREEPSSDGFTLMISIKAENSQQAKSKAIKSANNGFAGAKILKRNYHHSLWGLNNHPEIKKQVNMII